MQLYLLCVIHVISSSYTQHVHVYIHVPVEPDMSSLPESYFLDGDDDLSCNSSDTEQQQYHRQRVSNGRTRTDSGSFRCEQFS